MVSRGVDLSDLVRQIALMLLAYVVGIAIGVWFGRQSSAPPTVSAPGYTCTCIPDKK